MPKDCNLCQISKMPVYEMYYANDKILFLKECPMCKRPMIQSVLHRLEFEDEDWELIKFLHGEYMKDSDIDYDMNECVNHVHIHFNKKEVKNEYMY